MYLILQNLKLNYFDMEMKENNLYFFLQSTLVMIVVKKFLQHFPIGFEDHNCFLCFVRSIIHVISSRMTNIFK